MKLRLVGVHSRGLCVLRIVKDALVAVEGVPLLLVDEVIVGECAVNWTPRESCTVLVRALKLNGMRQIA